MSTPASALPSFVSPQKWDARAIGFKPGTAHDLAAELAAVEPRLRGVLFLAAGVSLALFGLPVIVTQVHRTTAEQDALYGYLQRRGITIPFSPHQFVPSHAIDLRVLHAPDPPTYGRTLTAQVNTVVNYGPIGGVGKFLVALYEDQGNNTTPHVHLQVPPGPPTGPPPRLTA